MLYIDFEAVKTYLNVDEHCAVITIAELIQITDAYLLGLSLLVEKSKSLELEKAIQRIKLYIEEMQKEVKQKNKDNHIDVLSKITLQKSTSEQLVKLVYYLYRTHEQIKDQPEFPENNKNILQQIYILLIKIYNDIIDFLKLNERTNGVIQKKNSFSLSCCFFYKMVSSVQAIEEKFSEQLSPERTVQNFQWKQTVQNRENMYRLPDSLVNPCSIK